MDKYGLENMGTMGNIGNLEAPCRPAIKREGENPGESGSTWTLHIRLAAKLPTFPSFLTGLKFQAKMGETPMERNGGVLFLDGHPIPNPTWDPGGAETLNRSWDYLPTSSGESRISEPSTERPWVVESSPDGPPFLSFSIPSFHNQNNQINHVFFYIHHLEMNTKKKKTLNPQRRLKYLCTGT